MKPLVKEVILAVSSLVLESLGGGSGGRGTCSSCIAPSILEKSHFVHGSVRGGASAFG